MNWKVKSAVQRACNYIPVGKQTLYRQLQLRCGKLEKNYDYRFLLSEAARMAKLLLDFGFSVEGATAMEVGTGWRIDMPLGLYLCGARRVVTCDLNRYFVKALAFKTVRYICENEATIREMFGFVDTTLLAGRLAALREASTSEQLFTTTGIEYQAPCDCSKTSFADRSIDLHYSYTVLEHIPAQTLEAILREANRLLSDRGICFHHIDPSDHFAQVDPSITYVNFLQFTDAEWSRYAGTAWSYHNRLRADEYKALFERVPQDILYWRPWIDERSLECLKNGFPLAPQFVAKPLEMLSTIVLDVISRPSR